MSAAEEPHPVVQRAADGRLPAWAVAGAERREHMARVASLLDGWAQALGVDSGERVRWRAVGHLHDALRDEDAAALRPLVPPELGSLPGQLLHGPAAAARLRADGVTDAELLRAVTYHTIGAQGLGRLGRALYAADFLEPGRTFLPEWRAERRARMPDDMDRVVLEIARARIENLLARDQGVLPHTIAFWNELVAEA